MSPTLGHPNTCNYTTFPYKIWAYNAAIVEIAAPKLEPIQYILESGYFFRASSIYAYILYTTD